ncbi:Radical SAM superfamily enzyme, MoaA/NifB/PqqE/SkfB family [Sporobacter termitidis DSM 10068]|uniref:Radical SAM superfamily enzyme, MoaA/NifB/PqqE/SkfB family n=1 Tax=Sporobacter termitidis DSM 10068 TaxID=1123282 RepID=A0A1M5YNH9_9FIRM|nr:radical SAM protein [Sporobacter termitidis]SHI13562.1 Radical SAM superfamily enzyme, MoaA/NifB/PqqE/SkfB family [Sporobacter termitidis DSM 10068]
MSIKSQLQAAGLRKAYDYVDKDPQKNLPKLVDFLDKFVPSGYLDGQLDAIRTVAGDPENNWYKYIMGLFTDIDDGIRRSIFENFAINASLKWGDIHKELEEKHNCNIPWAILMDPTSACNLRCTGCWAAEYGGRLNMTYEELDDIIRQANALGSYFFLYSGGEPLVRKADILRLCRAHPDCQFTAFTNGTLIDEPFADALLEVKNFIPAISVEGFEEDTDFRRGAGTFKKVERAMALLRSRRIPFGISCCYTSKNCEMIGSEAYFDRMIAWGAKFCWFFTYMPVGNGAVPELMVSAEQRKFMYEQVRKFRGTKPLFTLDFWNDGEYVPEEPGCIAGGRRYLHINAGGDIEPCAFIHYADANIREKSLLQALQSPLFMAYRQSQPFNENHLRPCPLLDNPGALTKLVETSGAHSTDMESPEDVRALSAKCEGAAENWAAVAGELWACSGGCAGCGQSRRGGIAD